MAGLRERQPDRAVPMQPGSLSHHEGAGADGRADCQQWLHFRPCAAAVFSAPYTSTKHAITGLTKATGLDGRAYNIAVGQIDIGNAETPMTQRMKEGVIQPDGSMQEEPVMDVKAVGDAIVYMAGLPLDANVQTITVMATKMPFLGRG